MAPKNRPTHKSSHPTETSATIRKVPSQYSEVASGLAKGRLVAR